MFKSLNNKFYAVVVMIFLLFGVSYGVIAYYLHKQDLHSQQVMRVRAVKKDIVTLRENFDNVRLWEKVILYQSVAEEEKEFGALLGQIREVLLSCNENTIDKTTQDDCELILFNINNYEALIAEILQLKTKEQLLDTRLVENFQSITSALLQADKPQLLGSFYGASQFFTQYQRTSGTSQFKALEIVMLSLMKKVIEMGDGDERLISYIKNFVAVLQESHVIEERILATSSEIESISVALSQDIEEANTNMESTILGMMEISQGNRADMKIMVFLASSIGALVLLCILLMLKNSIIGPVTSMAKVMAKVKNGDMSARCQQVSERNDEIDEMGVSLNTMLESVEKRDTTLQEYQQKLTEQLEELKRQKQEQQRLAQQLQRVEKMEAVGALAGGVAHDLNNILSGIVSYPELLLLDMKEDSPFRKPLHVIQDSGKRAVAIVQDLLTLARRGAAVLEVSNINHLVENYLSSPEFQKLKVDYPEIEIHTDLAMTLQNVKGSKPHLMKTIMNLVTNGIESIQGTGRIRLDTGNTYLSGSFAEYEEVVEGEYVSLTVADTGEGISASDLEHIFEPFFTRKEMGRSGTGLGLAVVWNTVNDHGGYVQVASGEEGTVFTLYFPVCREKGTDQALNKPIDSYLGNGEQLLLVDDVHYQREIGSKMLEKLGYKVAIAASGEEAVEYVRNNHVELLVLDMLMPPGIDGLETYRQILDSHPQMKAVLVSGYSETERVYEAQRLGGAVFVRKPYSLETIGDAVKRELSS